MQLECGKSVAPLGSFRSIIREKFFGRLHRGHRSVPQNCKTPKTLSGEAEVTQKLFILTGCSDGAAEGFVVASRSSKSARSPLAALQSLILEVKAVFPKAEVRLLLPRALWDGELSTPQMLQKETLNNLVSGSVGGFVGTVVNSDSVMKSRIQGAEKIPGVVPKYNWTYPGIVTIFREEVPAALYKCFVPKVLRLAHGGGVLLLAVEFALGVFRKRSARRVSETM
ncbi:hypothetical protein BC834DRAFT_970174 [Gloeopeniophorella convolvens]|nr:hypothetical protein BC834DRAFT_970174 [Gloeopeniophorella convolvens]